VSTVADLMEDALEVTMDYLEGLGKGTPRHHRAIAMEAIVFVRRAAKKKRHEYTEAEITDIIDGFLAAMKFYSEVTHMQGITSLDLTIPVRL